MNIGIYFLTIDHHNILVSRGNSVHMYSTISRLLLLLLLANIFSATNKVPQVAVFPDCGGRRRIRPGVITPMGGQHPLLLMN